VPLLIWVHAFSPDDVFVAGNDGRIFHFDGVVLMELDTPTDQQLWGVWRSANDDLRAVGGDAFMPGNVPVLP
jgi:hypothetical protein